MPKPKMSVAEAQEMWGDALAVIERLAEEFPCPNCDGHGDLYPGGCYHPCEECWGHGFQIPDDDDE